MNLTVTTADPQGRLTDHLLDLPRDATVADLAVALDARRLFLGESPLDAGATLGAGGVREGALLGLDAPAPAPGGPGGAWRTPGGEPALVEIRHVSGPGAGGVWRLGPGSYEAGTDRSCAIRLAPTAPDLPAEGVEAGEDGGAPPLGTWITVHADGSLSFRLPPEADAARCGLRSLTPPPPVDPETGTPLTDEEPAGREDGGPGGHSEEPPPAGPDGLPAQPPPPPPGQVPPPHDGSQPWPQYADLALGDHLLRAVPPYQPDAAVRPADDGLAVEYSRPPRLAPHLDAGNLSLPGPPAPAGPRPFPFMMMMSPLVMGLAMVALFRSFYFLILIVFTPLMAVGNWITGRRSNRRRYEEQLRRYRLRRAALESEMRRATVAERHQRNESSPDPAALLLTATGPGHQLWERRRHHADYLTLRLGTVARASLKTISDQARESNHRQVHWRLAEVPIGLDLPDLGVLGITGAPATARAVLRWAVAQAAVLHSPRDLRIVILTDAENAADWAWTRWLPHLRPGRADAGAPVISLGNDQESIARRVSELVAELQSRTAVTGGGAGHGGGLAGAPDVLVVMDGAWRLRDVPGVVQILGQGPALRIFSLCLAERERLLPEECAAVVTAEGNRLTLRSSGAAAIADVRADQVDAQWCEETARALAPVRDVTVDGDADLPAQVRLLPLIGQEPPDPGSLLAGWQRQPASTSFVVGAGYEGITHLDLAADGPHGLIGGTTGAGKSELLQTMIASLAVANRPDELTFVLIDYKGGSAFRECAELPHTLGMITDLDGHLVQRALASLGAELRRREQILADVGVKDHRDYRAKRARNPELAPLPRLMLIIDEFATLVRELPEFVPGLISLAQRGRSLGLHLLLATQRPAGAVSNEIRANTNLRIALRVTDRTESQDIINAPGAASLSPATPGRAMIRRGDGPPMPFQTAWLGAERPSGGASAEIDAGSRAVRRAELTWQQLGRPLALPAAGDVDVAGEGTGTQAGDFGEDAGEDGALSGVAVEAGPAADPPTDLSELVAAVREAAGALPDFAPQLRPWLPPLGERLVLDEPGKDPDPAAVRLRPFPYAYLDLPGRQEQRLSHIDLASFGHLYVIGAPRSGRTQVLRTIAGSAAAHLTTGQVHLYGIDAGGGGLAALESLPHCGAVVSPQDPERLERLIQRLLAELTARQGLIARHDVASVTELRAALPRRERPAHLLVLIDGWDALTGNLDKHEGGRLVEELLRLLREGPAAGIHVVATSERSLLGGRAGQHNDRRLVLRQSDRLDYGMVGIDRKAVPERPAPGRGWFAPGGVEAQVLLLPAPSGGPGGGSGDQADALRALGRRAAARDAGDGVGPRPFRVEELPAMVGFQEVADLIPEADRRPMWALLGVSGDAAAPLGFDFAADGGSFTVSGPPRSGRSTTLAAMCVSLLMGGTALVVLTPRESPLRRLGTHGLAEVLTEPDPSAARVDEALEAVAGRPAVVVVDDADLLAMGKADAALKRVASAGRDRGLGLLLAGPADAMTTLGWIGVARRARRGLLLNPKGLGDGDLIGVRLSAEHLRPPVARGRGWTADRSGRPVAVQVPLTVLEE